MVTFLFLVVDSSRPLVSALLLLLLCDILTAVIRRDDICGSYNAKRLYLELGERGVLTARNVTTALIPRSPYDTPARGLNISHEQCSLELITCPSCIITVTYRHLDLSYRCGKEDIAGDGSCRCDYVWVSEPPYHEKSGVPFCGVLNTAQVTSPTVPLAYRSQTRTLSIVLLFSGNHRHAFTLEYSAERNRQFLKSTSSSGLIYGNDSRGGLLTSPFFPALYPRDLGVEYVINCQIDSTTNCRVRIIFQDFLLATLSIMEFYDWNGNRLEVTSGGMFRPPVVLSSGPSLMVRFYANGGTGLGYKAVYSFIGSNLRDETVKPITDCGGYVENLGGAITMMNMVARGVKTYDCVWLIRPPKNFLHLKTHLYLKVASFLDMADSTDLKVIQGVTSDQHLLETIRHPIAQIHHFRAKEHIIPADVGFYVSFQGSFSSQSRLAIVYASFNYMECYTGSDFLCQNRRCIPIQLHCDGFDHCGDNSDEPESCFQDWEMQPQDKLWYAHTPNYYFPKNERYPDLKTATLVFVASSLGLILLISALIVLLYHMGNRARHQRELQNRLQTISDLLGDGVHINDSLPPDDPPTYEAPPDYDEIIKIFDKPPTTPRRRSKRIRCRSHLSPAAVHLVLDKSKPEPDSTNTLVNIRRSCQATPIPDTPPPPYMPHDSPGPSCSNVRLSQQGARGRASWLLFRDDTSSEDQQRPTVQHLDNTCTNVMESPCNNSINHPTAYLDSNQNLQRVHNSIEEDIEYSSSVLSNTPPRKVNGNLQPSFDSKNTADLVITNTRESTNSGCNDRLFHVKELQKISLSLDSLISRNDLEQHIPKPSTVLCNCAGACGCASLQRDNQRLVGIPRSMSEGLTLTGYEQNLHALDINYFSHRNFESERNSHF